MHHSTLRGGSSIFFTDFVSYLVSLAYLGFLSVTRVIDKVHVADLRRTNVMAAGLLPFHVWFVMHEIVVAKYHEFQIERTVLPFMWSIIELNHAILNICLFPPLFFFYGLYYTDVWSVLAVLTTIQFYHRKWTKQLVAAGISSLFFRQTNIFWAAIYLAGSEVVRRLKKGRPRLDVTVSDVVKSSWQCSCVYSPLISQACFEGRCRSPPQTALIDTFSRLHQVWIVLGCSIGQGVLPVISAPEALSHYPWRFWILHSVERRGCPW